MEEEHRPRRGRPSYTARGGRPQATDRASASRIDMLSSPFEPDTSERTNPMPNELEDLQPARSGRRRRYTPEQKRALHRRCVSVRRAAVARVDTSAVGRSMFKRGRRPQATSRRFCARSPTAAGLRCARPRSGSRQSDTPQERRPASRRSRAASRTTPRPRSRVSYARDGLSTAEPVSVRFSADSRIVLVRHSSYKDDLLPACAVVS